MTDLGTCVDLVLHDLTTPLSTQQMWLSVLRTRIEDAEMRSRALDAIDRCTQMQVRLVEDLRELSRVLRDEANVPKASVSISSIVAAAMHRIHVLATEQACELEARLAPDIELRGDRDKLARTMDHLLEHLVGRVHGGRLAIALVDDGAITLTRTPAEHVEKPTLSLIYARAMVQLHGGSLVVRDDTIELRFAT